MFTGANDNDTTLYLYAKIMLI